MNIKSKNYIQLFKPKFRSKEILKEIKKIFKTGWTGIGNKTYTFEKEWEKYSKLKNSLFVNSATAGLHTSLEVLKLNYKWNEKSEIITSPISFVSTSHSILYSGLKPIFCDIDYTGTIDPNKLIKLINKNTKGILFVGLGGSCGNLENINKICKKYKIKLILDAAHMSGAYINNQHVGKNIDVSIFSFQAVKNLPTADSGIINFKEKKLLNIARKFSWCGIDKDTYLREKKIRKKNIWEYDVPYLGYKYNGNSVMALIASVSLKYLDKDNKYRKKLANYYIYNLKKNKNIFIVPHTKGSSRHLFSILVRNRNKLISTLKKFNINPGVHYKSILEYKYYKKSKLKMVKGDLRISRKFSNQILSLPMHLFLKKKDVDKICSILNEYA